MYMKSLVYEMRYCRPSEAAWLLALGDSFLEVHEIQMYCCRPLADTFTGSILAACNWASGSFAGVALVAYQFCQRRRALEKDGIRRAVEVLDKKQAMKNMQEQAASGTGGTAPKATTTLSRAVDSTGAPGTTPSGTSAPSGIAANAAEKQNQNFWSTFKFW
jgi:hypothetical protein